MIRKATILLLILALSSCVSKKKTTYSNDRKVSVAPSKVIIERNSSPRAERKAEEALVELKADKIINSALNFSGTPYKYGGTTKRGMDCSGLLYVAFSEHDISLPRVSYVMADEGKEVRVKDVEKGDLLFFRTSKKKKRINHVGLVVATDNDEIKFIHASTSRGVIVSSLREGYWNYAFVKATRVL
ncbi:C40 family peptidase [Cellulophaga fucicola]|uniref:NlpC/P60 family protein n=1 Tax=Cellulophaga fucicola TaxID=76595 RepID=A0A1K1QUL4_9FLAO|nr:C40 family peptidase [Cellulophaga fucicola]SFW63445.1 NlpC/P60 family protein [Cellulophaga fucicola]